MLENEKSEDYMGRISWHRLMCSSPQNLFGTEIKTSNPIKIEICNAAEERDLNRNWVFSRNKIIEVEMSPIQWAEFLTSGNTEGVPCTLKWIRGVGDIPEPKADETMKVYNQEVEKHFDDMKDDFSEIKNLIDGLLSTGRMNKANAECLANLIHRVQMNMTSNMNYIKDCFKEDMESIVTRAKAEFNAYVETRVHEIGIEELKKGNVKFLEDKE